ncbi:MAG: hypothetical protein V7731_19970 [Amphritea sp.]
MQPQQWLSLTYAVGVGASLLVIGSAAGIVAMSKVEGLSFFRYMKYSHYYSSTTASALSVVT